jgi:hypothetical protein
MVYTNRSKNGKYIFPNPEKDERKQKAKDLSENTIQRGNEITRKQNK